MRFLEQVYPIIANNCGMHDGQRTLHANPARFRTLACGSRWGKTTASAAEIMAGMMGKKGVYWCVGPTYELADKPFRRVLYGWLNFRPEWVEKYSESNYYIRLKSGAECFGKSADHPASLLGEGVSGMTIDEPPVMKESVWQEFLQSRLNDTKGWAMFTGTPKGKGWYWPHFLKGRDGQHPDYFSMEGPTWQNPYIDKAWLLAQKGNYSDRYWQQEVLGMFLSDSGEVFKDIRNKDRLRGTWNEETGIIFPPKKDAIYSGGVDLAKSIDYTVISVLDADGQLVFWQRLPQGMPYPSQRARVVSVSSMYNGCTMYVDSSGIGDPVMDDFKLANAPVVGIKTAQEKVPMIDALLVAFDNHQIYYPDIPVLLNELEIFSMEKKESGKFSYKAPEGFHDDAVISLALAWRGLRGNARMAILGGIDEARNIQRPGISPLNWEPRF